MVNYCEQEPNTMVVLHMSKRKTMTTTTTYSKTDRSSGVIATSNLTKWQIKH